MKVCVFRSSAYSDNIALTRTGDTLQLVVGDGDPIVLNLQEQGGQLSISDKTMLAAFEGKSVFMNFLQLTYPSRLNATDAARIFGRRFAMISLPYKDSTLDDAMVILNIGPDNTATFNGVEITEEADGATMRQSLPSLSASATKNADTQVINVQLTRNGVNEQRQGVTVYAETTVGYLETARLETDANGRCGFVLRNQGTAVSGKVKVGFRWYSGEAETAVAF